MEMLASSLLARNRAAADHDESGDDSLTPICVAALQGNHEMVGLLLKNVRPGPKGDLRAEDWFRFLLTILSQNMFQSALAILDMNDSDTTAGVLHLSDNQVGTVLHVLAVKTGGEKCLNELVDRVWLVMRAFEPADLRRLICSRENRPPVLIEAAKVGNLAFIQKLFEENPNYIWEVDENGHTLFHVALLYRRYDVLWWLDEIPIMMKEKLAEMQDVDGNCLLHLAARVAANATRSELSNLIQLKQDFNLFEDVKKMVPDQCADVKNNGGQEPWELFVKEHGGMAETCEEGLKQKSKTMSLVSFILTFSLVRVQIISPLLVHSPRANLLTKLTTGCSVAMLIIFCYLRSTAFGLRQLCTFVPWAYLVGEVAFFSTLLGMTVVFAVAVNSSFPPAHDYPTSMMLAMMTMLASLALGLFAMMGIQLWGCTRKLGSRRRRKLFV